MKKFILSVIAGFIAFSFQAYSQKGTDTLKITTSAQCEMCEDRIEKAMAYERGVQSSDLDLDTRVLTVVFKHRKTTPEKIRNAVAAVGYDADDVKANERAYSKLPACCKKPDDPEHRGM